MTFRIFTIVCLIVSIRTCPSWASEALDIETVALIDSVVASRMAEGRYTLVARFFERLAERYPASDREQLVPEMYDFFARLHPRVRIEDSLQSCQLIEYARNCFSMMDSGGVFFTVGDVDAHAAWYLQRVLGHRKDLLVIALPFLMGQDYRQSLVANPRVQSIFGYDSPDSIPIPPSTASTAEALDQMVRRHLRLPASTPLYFSPTCALTDNFEGHIEYIGLVFAYRDSVENTETILDRLMEAIRHSWQLTEASHGMPEGSKAIKNAMIQYLTLAMMMAPRFHQAGRMADLNEFFHILEPVCRGRWRFDACRFMHCTSTADKCQRFLDNIREYAKVHPEDKSVQKFLEKLAGDRK